MPQIELSEAAYRIAAERAAADGFASVDEYVAEVVCDRPVETLPPPDLDPFFTPERLAQIDAAAATIRAGHGMTLEQVDAFLAARRAAWLEANRK